MKTEDKAPGVLQEHSLRFLEMAFRTDKRQIVTHPDGYGKQNAACGDSIEIFLTIRDDLIRSVSYYSEGCMNTNACANAVVVLAEGQPLETAWQITPKTITDYLMTLPPHEAHCAEMAANALRIALSDYRELAMNPWKKAYRK